MNEIDQDAVNELFNELLSGAVLDGKKYEDCEDPRAWCRSIVRSWYADRG